MHNPAVRLKSIVLRVHDGTVTDNDTDKDAC